MLLSSIVQSNECNVVISIMVGFVSIFFAISARKMRYVCIYDRPSWFFESCSK